MIQIDQAAFEKGLKRFRSAMTTLVNATRQRAKNIVGRHTRAMHKEARRWAPVARGTLRKGVSVSFENDGLTGTVSSTAGHAQWVEGQAVWTALGSNTGLIGRRPGTWPPDAPIREWVRLRGLPRKWGVSEDSATFLVRRKIGRRGTSAQPHIAPAFAKQSPLFENEIADVLKQAGEEAAKVANITGVS